MAFWDWLACLWDTIVNFWCELLSFNCHYFMWVNVPQNSAFSEIISARDLVSISGCWCLVWSLGDPWWVIWTLDIYHMSIAWVIAFSLTMCNMNLFVLYRFVICICWKLQSWDEFVVPFLLCFKLLNYLFQDNHNKSLHFF